MTWTRVKWRTECERWPCPWCVGKTHPHSDRPGMLYVYGCGDWWCDLCGALGGAAELVHVQALLDRPPEPEPSRELMVAMGAHRGDDARKRLREMARHLLRRCMDEPELALELLWPWAARHISPPATYHECEAVLNELAARHLDPEQA